MLNKIRIGLKRIEPIDVLSEKFTFGHRVSIGQILNQKLSDYQIISTWFQTWHNTKIKPRHLRKILKYFEDVSKGLSQWIEKEKALNYQATADEQRAGIEKISEVIKEFGTIDAIAVRMGISHNEALQLPYSTVYLMLLKDLETSKFERRLHKVHENKWKK